MFYIVKIDVVIEISLFLYISGFFADQLPVIIILIAYKVSPFLFCNMSLIPNNKRMLKPHVISTEWETFTFDVYCPRQSPACLRSRFYC